MATSTFERKIEVKDPESIRRLISIMEQDVDEKPLSDHPFTEKDRERNVALLKQCLSRSRI